MAKTANRYVRLGPGIKEQVERCCFEIELAAVYCSFAVKVGEGLTEKRL